MKLLTVATSRNIWLNEWELSALKWGYDYDIIGMGMQLRGFSTLISLIVSYLQEHENQNEIICIVDCYDLLMCGPPDELVEKFNNIGKDKMVIGGEKVCSFNCVKRKFINI